MPHDPVFLSYSHLHTFPRADDALRLFRAVAALVRPLMRARRWVVRELAEFYPDEPTLLGLNVARGNTIFLRLRHPARPAAFLAPEQIGDTLLHELAHIVRGPHDAAFHALWNELRDEHWARMLKKSAGGAALPHGSSSSRNHAPAAVTTHHRHHHHHHHHPPRHPPPPDPLAALVALAFRPRPHPSSRPSFPLPIPIALPPPPPPRPSVPHRSRHGSDPAAAGPFHRQASDHHHRHHRHHHRGRDRDRDRDHPRPKVQEPQEPPPQPPTDTTCATASPSYTDRSRAALAQTATRRAVHTAATAADAGDDTTASDAALAQALWDVYAQDEEGLPPEPEREPEPRWTCSTCTLLNPDVFLCCGACGRQRPPSFAMSGREGRTREAKDKTRTKTKIKSKTGKIRSPPSTEGAH